MQFVLDPHNNYFSETVQPSPNRIQSDGPSVMLNNNHLAQYVFSVDYTWGRKIIALLNKSQLLSFTFYPDYPMADNFSILPENNDITQSDPGQWYGFQKNSGSNRDQGIHAARKHIKPSFLLFEVLFQPKLL
jgi:hypothetical protein